MRLFEWRFGYGLDNIFVGDVSLYVVLSSVHYFVSFYNSVLLPTTICFNIRGLTVKFANSPPCACHGSSGQKSQYGLVTLAYQRSTAVLLLIYGSLFLSGISYCLSVFWCAIARMSELELEQGGSGFFS
jgi:hypothetical protein